ncbi:hypothetical protein ACN28E_10185 [Archangium lansingense]|uniref:hypothetical protein n=1 Tax=Archangium lansingense TaxID=2995310 RepID=UPI003B80A64C
MTYIPLRCAHAHFAPSVEDVALDYDPPARGRFLALTLEVRDADDTLLFEQRHDCTSGLPVICWDGSLNQGVDLATEPFATPLRSPYTLRLLADLEDAPIPQERPSDLSDSQEPPNEQTHCPRPELSGLTEPQQPRQPEPTSVVQVSVLYHSVEIVRGPWLATGQTFPPNSDEALCHQLNELGYYAGPPARAAHDATLLHRAKERFRSNHGTLRTRDNLANPDYAQALTQVADTERPTLVTHQGAPVAAGAVLPTSDAQPLRVYVEAIGFEVDLANNRDEFNLQYDKQHPTSKPAQEAQRLNRPLIPLEAVVYLKARNGSRISAPRAVGPVRVDWRATEPPEDTSLLPLDASVSSHTRSYIQRVYRQLVDNGQGGTNCLDKYGGIRTPRNNHRNPFWREAQPYAPYEPPQADDTNASVYVHANTDSTYAERVGRAGLYFHPSIIAGDRYRLSAELHFTGSRAVALQQANGTLRAETATLEVWRRTAVVAIVGWPTRQLGPLAQKCKEEYAHAFVELDFGATTYPALDTVLGDAQYQQWMTHLRTLGAKISDLEPLIDTENVRPNPIHLLSPHYDDIGKMQISFFVDRMFSELRVNTGEGTTVHPSAAEFLSELVASQVRVGHPSGGLLFIEYSQSQRVREICETVLGQVPTLSSGNGDLTGIIDQSVPGAPYYIFSHEAGHCFWLRHHENAPDSNRSRQDHDPLDHNCVMSYTKTEGPSHQKPENYAPHFCGKCNLKLRGWNILHPDFQESEAADTLTTVFTYDAADPGLMATTELATVRNAVTSASRAPFKVLAFDRNPVVYNWLRMLDCDIFHHVSHGNVRCSRHGWRAPSMDLATPRYPYCCLADEQLMRDFCLEHGAIFDSDSKLKKVVAGIRSHPQKPLPDEVVQTLIQGAHAAYEKTLGSRVRARNRFRELLTASFSDEEVTHLRDKNEMEKWAARKLIHPEDDSHPMRGVIQWTVELDDSSKDVELTFETLQKYLTQKDVPVPRVLAFFSSCLLGWNSAMARLFIDAGTRYVIAFRSRYETAQALHFAKFFYEKWASLSLNPDSVRLCFMDAAVQFPHAEPVLFDKDGIFRAHARTMQNGSGEITLIEWGAPGFSRPLFPQRN